MYNLINENRLILADNIGYAYTEKAFHEIINLSIEKEQIEIENTDNFATFSAVIAAHDDHVYSSRVNIHIFPKFKCKRVIIFGVNHKTKGIHDHLIFDNFSEWRSIYGNVKVDKDLREKIIQELKEREYEDKIIISNEIHAKEYSIEALIPWLQYFNKEVEIIPIIVPRFLSIESINKMANIMGNILNEEVKKRNWKIGDDIGFLFSNDCIHYGDEGFNTAVFGTTERSHEQAIERDQKIIQDYLRNNPTKEKINDFVRELFDFETLTSKIAWCGTFSIAFGLLCYISIIELLQKQTKSVIVKYGSSYSFGPLNSPVIENEFQTKGSPGPTAPCNLNHWVGYTSIGYILE